MAHAGSESTKGRHGLLAAVEDPRLAAQAATRSGIQHGTSGASDDTATKDRVVIALEHVLEFHEQAREEVASDAVAVTGAASPNSGDKGVNRHLAAMEGYFLTLDALRW